MHIASTLALVIQRALTRRAASAHTLDSWGLPQLTRSSLFGLLLFRGVMLGRASSLRPLASERLLLLDC